MNYNTQHRFYCGVDLHARSLFTHILDHKGKTVFEEDWPMRPGAGFNAGRGSRFPRRDASPGSRTLRGSSYLSRVTGRSARRGFWGVAPRRDSRISGG